MTDSDLRDLFQAAAADPDRHDPTAIDRAWRDGSRRRVGARAAVVGSVAASAAAVTGVAMLDLGSPVSAPTAPSTRSPSSTPAGPEQSGPVTTYEGAPVWVVPRVAEESDLPVLEGSGLPGEIDLTVPSPSASGIDRAVGVLAVVANAEVSRVVVVGADGATYSLDIGGRLERVTDEGGNAMSALSQEGLSPDGTRVFFRQERSLVVYDFRTGAWTDIATPRWTAETARWMEGGIWVPEEPYGRAGTVYALDGPSLFELTVDEPAWAAGDAYGPERISPTGDTAQSYFLTSDFEADEWPFVGVNAVVVSVEGRPRVLVHDMYQPGGKMCCPVAGWLEPSVLAFQSGAGLLAWPVPGGGVRRVSEITGLEWGRESYVASWAFSAL